MLTSLLRDNPDLAERLRMLALYEARRCPMAADLIAPPRTQNYALVGTAMDYLVRWNLERLNTNAKDRPWVATIALSSPILAQADETIRQIYHAVVAEATLFHAQFVKMRYPTMDDIRRAASLCLCLAKVDPLFRTGTLDEAVSTVNPLDLTDLLRLYEVTPWADIGGTPGAPVLLNPEFGQVSTMFNGADADLVVGTTLLDMKTVKAFDLAKYLPQLLGYVAISDLYRETEDPSFPRFERAGIHFVRHGKVVSFPLVSVRENPEWQGARDALFATACDTFGTMMPKPVAERSQ